MLYGFNGNDGGYPTDVLLLGASGELYGTTSSGGRYDSGTAFRLDFSGSSWIPTTLRNFGAPMAEGAPPDAASPSGGLVFGTDGLLYGDTDSEIGLPFSGTVFSLSPTGHSKDYRIIHRFDTPTDGSLPAESLLPVGSDLVGTTGRGPLGGTVFRMFRNPAGRWKETIVYQFGLPGDFSYPVGPLVRGRGNVLYGCAAGGAYGHGGVYALTKSGPQGQYAESIIYSFGMQANDPETLGTCGVAINSAGQVFGSTDGGGAEGYGTLFELDPPAAGASTWTETVLHNFDAKSGNGIRPQGAPLRQGGVYYGVTAFAAASSPSGSGVVYQFTP